jgi:hypothetical protein
VAVDVVAIGRNPRSRYVRFAIEEVVVDELEPGGLTAERLAQVLALRARRLVCTAVVVPDAEVDILQQTRIGIVLAIQSDSVAWPSFLFALS